MRTWLIIGSTATYHWFSDARLPKDLDLLTPAKISGNVSKVCIVDAQWHDLAEELIAINQDPVFADPDVLLTLKVSHAHWDIHHQKTLSDINFLLHKGCKLNLDLYQKLIEVWKKVHSPKFVNLNKSNEDFFSDAVARTYDHDTLHHLLAFNGAPMYERIKPDLTKAWCSKEMFNSLSADEQLQTALEEIMVTAVERGRLSSFSTKIDIIKAVHLAHRKLCTSMTSGWFARFLILNNFELLIKGKPTWLTILTATLKHLH